ncbi:PHP domain-containing protein [Streptococcus sciuri]|uniref:Histidinol-phosphatase n=1 Tax=Streptococcus sciuri TaxID=2973939 RepID=A0ABT2F5G6_9STRE|nr:PHP domain-containing protein [Streptococcus sciuri]MCS4487698.1 PHP domain-containing protein [Streptococcus sciuri]
MRDNHLHTFFSYDSKAQFEDYLRAYSGEIVTTEHFDLSNPYSQQDDIPDYERYCHEIERLNALYGNRIKKGIEIGYFQPREADIKAYLAGKDFDLKLLSVHHNGIYDYLDDKVETLPKDAVITDYLKRLDDAIGRVEADVLAHFDYGFRRFDVTTAELKKYENQLCSIFQKMMDKHLAFELNAKSMYLYNHEHLYCYALELLTKLGCKCYSIGSDGHQLEHFRLNFDKITALLADYGISESQLIS